jgi:hypothetical protein
MAPTFCPRWGLCFHSLADCGILAWEVNVDRDGEQYGVASFDARKRDDDRVTQAIAIWLRQALPALEVRDVTGDRDYWARDIDLLCQLDRHSFTVEVKADQQATTTGNLFLETISVEIKPSKGWLTLTEADLLFYYCAPPPPGARSPRCQGDCLYVLLPDRLREWFLAERRRWLRHPGPRAGQAARKQARADKRAFDKTWRIRATHTVDPQSGQYQHTTLGWTVALDYVNARYFEDTYGGRAEQMRRLMVIADVAQHLDVLAEVVRSYVSWARRRGEKK